PNNSGQSDEGVPSGGVTGSTAGCIGEHHPDTPEGDGRHEFLKAWALTSLTRLASLSINAPDPFGWPAQGQGAWHERILVLAGLVMLGHLLQRRLSDIAIGRLLMVVRRDFVMAASGH